MLTPNPQRLLLAIESSCDDTSAAVLRGSHVLSNVVATQEVHESYGGVVPELASRVHQQNIVPTIHAALAQSGCTLEQLDGVAYTRGPGLMGSLHVGAAFAKSLAMSQALPLVGVNHMEAHILAHFIQDQVDQAVPAYPFLCLTVSGGHTQIVRVDKDLDMRILGQTIDDAAGEAFDKIAKLLGLVYPGGPLIDKHARVGDAQAFDFPQSRLKGYDFSFSGLKTSVLYFLQKQVAANPTFIEENLADVCASAQRAIVTPLLDRLFEAAKAQGISTLALAGGVSANSELRRQFEERGKALGMQTFVPAFQYCTDNAAMVGMAGQMMLDRGITTGLELAPTARWVVGSSRS